MELLLTIPGSWEITYLFLTHMAMDLALQSCDIKGKKRENLNPKRAVQQGIAGGPGVRDAWLVGGSCLCPAERERQPGVGHLAGMWEMDVWVLLAAPEHSGAAASLGFGSWRVK